MKLKKAVSMNKSELVLNDDGTVTILERDKESEIISATQMSEIADMFTGMKELSISIICGAGQPISTFVKEDSAIGQLFEYEGDVIVLYIPGITSDFRIHSSITL